MTKPVTNLVSTFQELSTYDVRRAKNEKYVFYVDSTGNVHTKENYSFSLFELIKDSISGNNYSAKVVVEKLKRDFATIDPITEISKKSNGLDASAIKTRKTAIKALTVFKERLSSNKDKYTAEIRELEQIIESLGDSIPKETTGTSTPARVAAAQNAPRASSTAVVSSNGGNKPENPLSTPNSVQTFAAAAPVSPMTAPPAAQQPGPVTDSKPKKQNSSAPILDPQSYRERLIAGSIPGKEKYKGKTDIQVELRGQSGEEYYLVKSGGEKTKHRIVRIENGRGKGDPFAAAALMRAAANMKRDNDPTSQE